MSFDMREEIKSLTSSSIHTSPGSVGLLQGIQGLSFAERFDAII